MSEILIINTDQNLIPKTSTPTFKCSGYGLGELIKDMVNPVGLEIGTDIGDTSTFLMASNETLFLHTVDPYTNYIDWNGKDLNERQKMYETYMNRMSQYSDRFEQHRKTSDDAVGDFEDGQFDFIFIDGLHTYEQLSKDCINYYSKLKDGGIFSGHDFTAITGVNKAAKEFAEKVNKEISTTECDVWYWIK